MIGRVKVVFPVAVMMVFGCSREAPPPPSGMPPFAGEPGAKPTPATGLPSGLPPKHPALGVHQDIGLPHGEGLPAGHPPVGGAPGEGSAPALEGSMPGGAFDPTKTLTGSIDVAPALAANVKPVDAVFLSVRLDDGSEKGGMILAVKRFPSTSFPIPLALDGRDAMSPGTKFEGKVVVTAYVDKDGDAMSHNPGDLVGVAHVTIPAKLKLSIDKTL